MRDRRLHPPVAHPPDAVQGYLAYKKHPTEGICLGPYGGPSGGWPSICGALLFYKMYSFISFRKSTPPQNRQLNVHFH